MKNRATLALCAITSFATVLNTSAQSSEEYLQKAYAALEQENHKDVIAYSDSAIALGHPEPNAYYLKGESQYQLEMYEECLHTYTEGIERFPEEANFYGNRGNLLISFDQYEYALYDFNKAIELADTDTLVIFFKVNRGACHIRYRRFDLAYDDLKAAYDFDSNDVASLTNLATVCQEMGRNEETLKYLTRTLELDSTFYAAYTNIGFTYQGMDQHEKAIEYFDLAIEKNPAEPYSYSNRSYSKLRVGDVEGAMADIETSISMAPGNSYAYRNRALIYMEKDEDELACADLLTALNLGFTTYYGEEVAELYEKHCE